MLNQKWYKTHAGQFSEWSVSERVSPESQVRKLSSGHKYYCRTAPKLLPDLVRACHFYSKLTQTGRLTAHFVFSQLCVLVEGTSSRSGEDLNHSVQE